MASTKGSHYPGVYPSGKSHWQYRLLLPPDEHGKRKPEVRGGFLTPEAAALARERRQRQVGLGIGINGRQYTVAEWVEEYITGKAKAKPSSRKIYRDYLELYIRPYAYLAQVRLDALTPAIVRRWTAELLKRETERSRRQREKHQSRERVTISPNTVREVRGLLSAALIQAMRDEMIERNVVAMTETPTARKHIPHVWSDAEILDFLERVRDDDFAAAWYLAILGQLRPGEIIALRWQDVDWRNSRVIIDNTRTEDEQGHETFGPAKTPASRAPVTLPASCMQLLRVQQQRVRELAGRYPPGYWQDEGWVFPGRAGGMLAYRTLSQRLDRLLADLDMPRITPHELRHSGATMLARAKEAPKAISDRLRHASVAFTMDVYVTLASQDRAGVAARLEERLTAPPAAAVTPLIHEINNVAKESASTRRKSEAS